MVVQLMNQQKIVVKRIVSPDGKVIAEAKSVVQTSGDGETSQTVSVNVSSGSSSRSYAKSHSSHSFASSSSSSSSGY